MVGRVGSEEWVGEASSALGGRRGARSPDHEADVDEGSCAKEPRLTAAGGASVRWARGGERSATEVVGVGCVAGVGALLFALLSRRFDGGEVGVL